MDPDANIAEQRRLKAAVRAGTADRHDRARLRELQAALREWIRRGGFAPRGYHRTARGTLAKNKARKMKGIARTYRTPRHGPLPERTGRKLARRKQLRGMKLREAPPMTGPVRRRKRILVGAYCPKCRGPHVYRHGKRAKNLQVRQARKILKRGKRGRK